MISRFRNILPKLFQANKSIRASKKIFYHRENYTLSSAISRLYSNEINNKPDEMIIDYTNVKNAIHNKKVLIIDVREPEERKEHGAIPNSVNIPLGTITEVFSNMKDIEFETTFKRHKPTEDTEVICYCMIGKRSGMAQKNLINLGYKNVKNYLGSWTDWASKSS